MSDREADARLAAACPMTTGTAEDWRRYAQELVAAERARIIAMMLAEADALAGRVDSDITTYSGAVALRRLAELLGKEAAK